MLDALFRPKSVAVIGASNRRLTIGYRIIQNLFDHEFNGPIFPVHPKAAFIKNLPAYPNIKDVPGDVDLAHIVVKNTLVPQVMKDCAAKGVRAVIINTAGFKEIGEPGIALEKEVVEIAKKAGIRVFGPNCQGVMNSDPEVRAYCNFTFTRLEPGHISLYAQSGGVGEVINNRLYELGAGLRMYASNGNACDVSVPEIIRYWGDDPDTRVIICHVESIKDPAGFLEVAREVAKKKPILAMKTGRTREGAKAVSSHTGGLMKADTTAELIFDEAGLLSFRDEEEICQAALAFAKLPEPRGNRVGIITNTGGPGIIATDELIEGGCALPDIAESTKTSLKEVLFPEASLNNPVDVLATAGPEHWEAATKALLADENVDSILLSLITPFFVDCKGVAERIAALAPEANKPIIPLVMTEKRGWADTLATFQEAGLPVFDLPETASKALAAMCRYAVVKERAEEAAPKLEVDAAVAAKLIDETLAAGREFMPQKAATELLEAYGIAAPKCAEVGALDEVEKAAAEIGYPVALKVESEEVVHKSDAGGVALGLADKAALAAAFAEMDRAFGDHRPRYLVAAMQEPAREVLLGAKREDGLGHLVVFGLGGIFVEVLKDASFGLAPFGRARARRMIEGLKGYPILAGTRGQGAVDFGSLEDALCRLSRLVADNPRIAELDLNPVFAYEEGRAPVAVDVRIKLG